MFLKECKKVLTSVTFLIFTGVMLLAFVTQYGGALSQKLEEPQPGLAEYSEYGHVDNEDEAAVMQQTLEKLIQSYQANEYTTYPLGFYRLVRLNDSKRQEMAELLCEFTGIPAGDIQETVFSIPYYALSSDGNVVQKMPEGGTDIPALEDRMTYAQFEERMAKADELIGGGSDFGGASIRQHSQVPMNYEQALEAYNAFAAEGFTPGYARLFCDYMGIFASLFPAFAAIYQTLKDKSAGMRDIIYTRKASSLRLAFTRYFALTSLCSLVVLALAAFSTLCHLSAFSGMATQPLAFFKYTVIWIIPSIMASAAIGTFTAELTDTPVGILLMAAYWFVDLSMGGNLLAGSGSAAALIPRHNSELYTGLFAEHTAAFLSNRIFFALASLILICITALILELKRRGRWIRFEGSILKVFTGRKSQPAV